MFLLSMIYLIMHYGGAKPIVNERSKRKMIILRVQVFNYSAERSALRMLPQADKEEEDESYGEEAG